jgi:The GLUG motif
MDVQRGDASICFQEGYVESSGRIFGSQKWNVRRRQSEIVVRMPGLYLLFSVFCLVCSTFGPARADEGGRAATAQTSIYVFVPEQSTVVKTGGFVGVHETYFVKGRFQLTVDSETNAASFNTADAKLTTANGEVSPASLNAIFNMTGLAGVRLDDTTIEFDGKTADGTNSDVRLTLTFAHDSARLVGQITPPPNSADMFFYDLEAAALRKYAGGTGEPNTPYLIGTAEQMNTIGAEPNDWDQHFRLIADIDLGDYSGTAFNIIAPAGRGVYFTGVFDGGGHTISHFTYTATDVNSIALFGNVRGLIENVGVIDPNIEAATRDGVAPLADWINEGGSMRGCYVRGGSVSGSEWVGGLVAYNTGTITDCCSTTAVDGQDEVGGLTGYNDGVIVGCSSAGGVTGPRCAGGLVGWNDNTISGSHSTAEVTGDSEIGGLAGQNNGTVRSAGSTGRVTGVNDVAGLVGRSYGVISNCYATGEVSGDLYVGGLVGFHLGTVTNCYSAGTVAGNLNVGGLIGAGFPEDVLGSFWDIETSGQPTSAGGTGKTTTEMQKAQTFLDAGWDFVGETDNGTEDLWRILDGLDYPRLSWEPVLADDFEDGVAPPFWQLYEPEPEKIAVEETNGRLEVRASEAADDVNAAYVSNGWRLDVTNNFELKVNFHYARRDMGDSWLMVALLPSLAEPASRVITLEAGCLEGQPFYLYEATDGFWTKEESSNRSGDDGTLYVSFDAGKDELYLSYTGYGESNAWRTVTGLLKGRWKGAPVYVALGGGSDQVNLGAGDAYLDDFAIDSGLLE